MGVIPLTVEDSIIGKAIDHFLAERMNEKNVERSLENLELLCEVKA